MNLCNRALFALLICLPSAANAQATKLIWPNQPVKIVVPIQPNGIIDAVAKPVADALAQVTGQKVTTDYQPGALTNTGTAAVAHGPANGYTLLAQSRQLVNNAFIFKNLSYDLRKDLTPISLVARTDFVIVVSPKLPVNSIADLIQLAKSEPGKLSYANSGKASNQQMSVELFKQLSGTNIARVEYDGGGGALDAVASGKSDIGIFAQGAVIDAIKQGKVKALATTGAKRSRVLPNLPTVAEAGLPGYEFSSWVGLFAPARTPGPVVQAIYAQLVKAGASPDFIKTMSAEGADVVIDKPADFAAFVQSELRLWGPIIQKSGIKPE